MLPEPLLEQLRAGDLDPDGSARLHARLSPVDRERLAALDASDAEILERYPPRVVMAHLASRRRRRRRWVLTALAAVAALLLVVRPTTGIRDKGDVVLTVFAGEHRLVEGDTVAAGERLRLVLDPGTADHAAVISVDGLSQVTIHFPVQGQRTQVPPGGAFDLPMAFVLDDAPAWEAFYAVAADEPIDVQGLVAQARALAVVPDVVPPSLTLPSAWRQARVAVRKSSRATPP